jgi:hypothetical protein
MDDLGVIPGPCVWEADSGNQTAAFAVAELDLHLVGNGELTGDCEPEAGAAG